MRPQINTLWALLLLLGALSILSGCNQEMPPKPQAPAYIDKDYGPVFVSNDFSYSTNGGFVTIIGHNLDSTNETGVIDIPDKLQGMLVTAIRENAFIECYSSPFHASRITIPAGVTHMGKEVFTDCFRLTGVYFKGDAPMVDNCLFDKNCPTNLTVYYVKGAAGWINTFSGRPTALWDLKQEAATNTPNLTGKTM